MTLEGWELRQTLVRRPSEFLCVAWSPDCRLVAGAASDGLVWLWEAATGKFLQVLEGHRHWVRSVAWSPDGRSVASGSVDRTIRLWDAATGKARQVLEGHKGAVWSVAWSPDGRALASGSADRTIRLWDCATGKAGQVLEDHKGSVDSVAWSPDGRTLASGSEDRTVRLWEAATGQVRYALEGHRQRVRTVAWSPDGLALASGSEDRTVRLWEGATGGAQQVLQGHERPVRSVAWSPNGQALASASNDRTIRLWNAATGNQSQLLEGHTQLVRSVVWRPDGRVLASGSADRTIRLWESLTGKVRLVLTGHTNLVEGVAWSPDGRALASANWDNTVRLWEAATGEARQVLEGHTNRVASVVWRPDGRVLASGGWDNSIRLWEATTGKARQVLRGHRNWVGGLAWSPDGRALASASDDRTIRLWEAATGEAWQVLQSHTDSVRSLAWSPDGRWLASGSADRTIHLWDVPTGKMRLALEGHTRRVSTVAWSPDGRTLASGSVDRTIRLWEAATGKAQQVLEGHTNSVQSVSWSPDGRMLASISERGDVRIWEVPSGELKRVIDHPFGFRYMGSDISFRPAGCASSFSDDGIVVLAWGLTALASMEALRGQVHLASAKVVLVGDSEVGKSCLALRLAEDKYEERGTTHGMQIWPIAAEKLDPAAAAPPNERREVFLWDLGGQPEYRLVHQLFLHDTTLALLLCEAARGETAFQQVRNWNESLEARLRGRGATKLLVRSKLDQGGVVDRKEIERLKRECGFADYYELSAKEGTNLPQFRQALSEALRWDQVTRVTRPLLFQQIRERVDNARSAGQILLYYENLEAEFQDKRDALDLVVSSLAAQGLVVDLRLASGDRVLLLRVDAAERYAGSVILAARDNPRGVPALEQRAIGAREMTFPGIKDAERLPRAEERVVLECVVELLIQNGLCLRHEGLLVFPSLFRESAPAGPGELPHRVPIYYDFTGPIDNIYASLVVKLALSNEFGTLRMFNDRSEYERIDSGLFGLHKVESRRGGAHLDLYFNDAATQERRDLFVVLVEDHLRKEGVRITEGLSFACANCGFRFEEELLRARLAEGEKDVGCSKCDRRYLLTAGAEKARKSRPELEEHLVALRSVLDSKIEQDVADTKKAIARAAEAAPGKRPIRILHLSDLHLRQNDSADALVQPLLADLDDLERKELDYIVVSGDLADRGQPVAFEAASKFLSQLIEWLRLSAERCLLVPGNHDVNQRVTVYQYRAEVPLEEASGRPNAKQGDIYLLRDDELYPTRFELFRKCYHQLKQTEYPLRHEEQAVLVPFPETGIEFLLLNSAWEIDRFYPKRASIHPQALAKALLNAGSPKDGLRIAVWHHAVTGNDKIRVESYVGNLIKAGFRLCLHGDVHEPRAALMNHLDPAKTLHVVGAGSFAAKAEDRPESVPRMYNLLEVERDLRRVRVTVRKQDRENEAFGPFPVRETASGTMVAWYDINLH